MTTQASLFGDKARERADVVGRELVQQLHSFARHRGVPRPTVLVLGVQLGGEAFTAQLMVDGKLLVVINRRDVAAAARDLWTQFAGDLR